MKTDTLIDLLATGAGAAPRHSSIYYFAPTIVIGILGATALLVAMFGINPALREYLSLAGFWIKFAFAATLLFAGTGVLVRLARPGIALASAGWFAAMPVLVLWALALFVLIDADPSARVHLVLGNSWSSCPANIALLSLPAFVATALTLRRLAPTELRLAGAAAGLASGALGAVVYCLYCPELALPFLGVWYVLGILIPTVVGYFLGPRMLRW